MVSRRSSGRSGCVADVTPPELVPSPSLKCRENGAFTQTTGAFLWLLELLFLTTTTTTKKEKTFMQVKKKSTELRLGLQLMYHVII